MTDEQIFSDEPTLTDNPTLTDQPSAGSGKNAAFSSATEEFLSTPAEQSDDLELMLAARPPRRKLPKATLLLATGALLGAGFAGGIEAQKHLGSSSSGSSSAFSAIAAALRGAGSSSSSSSGAKSSSGFASLFGGETVGTVLLVDGSTVYVTSSSGGIVKVSTTPSTAVELIQSGTLSQLKPGESIVVRGSTSSSGTVNASSISEGSAGGLGGGGGFEFRGTGAGG
jgi:hypothetical protein